MRGLAFDTMVASYLLDPNRRGWYPVLADDLAPLVEAFVGQFDLLVTLATAPRTVLTRERLLAEVWDWVDASGTRTVDSHVKAVRRKLGADLIRTVHGVGYAFEPADPTE